MNRPPPAYLQIANETPAVMYSWDRTRVLLQIFAFLDRVAQDPVNNGVTAPAEVLGHIRDRIRTLSLGAPHDPQPEFDRGDCDPRQHIYRRENQDWDIDRAHNSKFRIPIDWNHQFAADTPERIYWSPFDLLGLFLSLCGPAQPNADKENFYLPLTAMYSRWCRVIGTKRAPPIQVNGSRVTGVGDPSYYHQCTWDPHTRQFFLGASLAGYEWMDVNIVGQWETGRPENEEHPDPNHNIRKGLRWSRYEILKNNFLAFGYSFDTSPVRAKNPTGQRFGNCAETYPFMEMLGRRLRGGRFQDQVRAVTRRLRGLALTRDYVYHHMNVAYNHNTIIAEEYGQYGWGRKYLGPPCTNSREVSNPEDPDKGKMDEGKFMN
ncbi:hypothetical protein F53441_12530 [Fusarium austroafricanum]|uniref:Uncharacterized protein n=1 Tax=Fusarium austroafricanum TaxID=2364996 RepID=A0A8H4NIW6_9HYPO|nr:hypothetical protein F53441_12530 [Fusarium austroafricanum]